MLSRVNTHVWLLSFWFCWLTCTALFLLPAADLPDVNIWDKAAHAGAFAMLMLLAWQAWQRQPVLLLGVALALYGFTIECLQHFIPGRSFSLLDAVADTVGLIPILLWARWSRRA